MEIVSHLNKEFNKIVYTHEITKHREFENCTFLNCDFSNGTFLTCTFTSCTFKGCNLTMTKFSHSQLDKIVFSECKLLGINFSECTDLLFSVKFEHCVLDCCTFSGKNMRKTAFIDSTVKEVDFSDCELSNSEFQNTDLAKSVFNGTKLSGADFRTAFNFSIDPEFNDIKYAKFSIHGLTGLLDKYKIEIE